MADQRIYKALLMGNGSFPADRNNLIDLRGPAQDVPALLAALTHEDYGLHDPDHVLALIDVERQQAEAQIEEFFNSAGPLDQLLFYYSGHGWQDIDRLYFCTADTRSDKPLSTAVSDYFVRTLAETTKAAAVVIALDCCYSGGFKGEPTQRLLGRGRWVLSSSRWNQPSRDASDHDSPSPFTAFAIEALTGGDLADTDGDGFISVTEVHDHVKPRLEAATGQISHLRCDATGQLAVARGASDPGPHATDVAARAGTTLAVPPIPREAPEAVTAEPHPPTATPLADQLSWRMDAEEFSSSVLDALDRSRSVPMRLALQQMVRDAAQLMNSETGWEQLGELLDRLACFSATTINIGDRPWFEQTLRGWVGIYETGFDPHGLTRTRPAMAPNPSAEELWLNVLQRLECVGALAVRLEAWWVIKPLVLQRPEGHDFRYWNVWLRHALTMAARANLFRREEAGRITEESLLTMAASYLQAQPCLRPDVEPPSEKLLDSLCQFDFLACVIPAVTWPDDRDGRHYYTNFARFYSRRATPIVRKLLTHDQVRTEVAPVEDPVLADALIAIDSLARSEGVRWDGWSGLEGDDIRAFVQANATVAR